MEWWSSRSRRLAYAVDHDAHTHIHGVASGTILLSENKNRICDHPVRWCATCPFRKNSRKFLFWTYQSLIWSQNEIHDQNEEQYLMKNELLSIHVLLERKKLPLRSISITRQFAFFIIFHAGWMIFPIHNPYCFS